MIIAAFIIAAVASVPFAAIVVVSIASRREDAAWSLGQPPRGMVQAAARRVLDFSTECSALQLPKSCSQPSRALPAPRVIAPASVGQDSVGQVIDMPGSATTSKISVGTAA